MKVGIITFTQTINFGASLQAYALQESVDAMGHQAEVIRYVNRAIEAAEKNTGKLSLKTLSKKFTMRGDIRKKTEKFRRFEEAHYRYGMTLNAENADAVSDAYGAFLAGSDQIWNTRLSRADWTYFLDFVSERRKKISYAASFGDRDVLPEYREKIGELLNGFGQLSVRERAGTDIIAALTGREAAVTVDPTLLLTKEQWEERVDYQPDHAPYILVYFPHDKKAVFEFVKRLQKKTGLPVVYLSISPRPQPGVETIYDTSPEEFVGWIRHAAYVVTGSFHGTAFSINLEKQVFCDNKKEGSRVGNLLRICGLTDRTIDSEGVLDREIDYTLPRQRLAAEREQSLEWLRGALTRAADDTAWQEEPAVTVPVSKEECCGCAACVSVCPTAAIAMQRDARGFAYPAVDESKCVRCGLCRKACAFSNGQRRETRTRQFYAVRHKQQETRMGSTSGAVFVAASDVILAQGGAVYGCALDENFHAAHIRATDKATRDRICKTKYVGSDTDGVTEQIAADLQNGLPVLFSGTGCQVDGVRRALQVKKINTDRLYLMDLICHGCPSPLIYEDYLGFLEKKHGAKLDSFCFRDKTLTGWEGYIGSYTVEGKKYADTAYRQIFQTDAALRPSCYRCKYAAVDRDSDLTFGDAWGIKTALPAFNDNRGVSVVLVQSEKGRELLRQIAESCDIAELPPEPMTQRNLRTPSQPRRDVEKFWYTYREKGIDGIVAAYGQFPAKKKLKSKVKYRLRKLLQSRKYYLP